MQHERWLFFSFFFLSSSWSSFSFMGLFFVPIKKMITKKTTWIENKGWHDQKMMQEKKGLEKIEKMIHSCMEPFISITWRRSSVFHVLSFLSFYLFSSFRSWRQDILSVVSLSSESWKEYNYFVGRFTFFGSRNIHHHQWSSWWWSGSLFLLPNRRKFIFL